MKDLPPINETIRSLFDPLPTPGEERRDEGMQRVADNDPTWHERALLEIQWLMPGQAFSSDLLHDLMGDDKPEHPNNYGAAINAATRLELIEVVGFTKSKRPAANARRILQYRRK